jgi:LacI family transcriptional regulator
MNQAKFQCRLKKFLFDHWVKECTSLARSETPMHPLRMLSFAEQVAAHLRQGLHDGRWSGRLPGVLRLAAECDVSTKEVRAALRQLEAEGLLSGRGPGRSRTIAASATGAVAPPLRVAIQRHDARLTDNLQTSLVLTEIMHSLEAAGHEVFFCNKSQIELKHDVRRLASQLLETPADAWVVESGSRPLLEWCASQATPCLALYGRADNLPLACTGPDVVLAHQAATRHLLALGHRRIVFILREPRRKPTLGKSAHNFLEDLAAHGVPTGAYNLPDWEETPEGLSKLLERLFRHSPPTALIIDEIPHFIATVAFCARHGIRVPEHVSLISTDDDPSLAWCHPGFAHMRWDSKPVIRRVVRWVDAVRKGKADRKIINFPAEFIPGGSIGPARARA